MKPARIGGDRRRLGIAAVRRELCFAASTACSVSRAAWPLCVASALGGARAACKPPATRPGAAYFTAGAANFATLFWRAATRGRQLMRRLVSWVHFMGRRWHTVARLQNLAQSLTPHGNRTKKREARTSRRARPPAVPGTPRNPARERAGCSSSFSGGRQTRFEHRCARRRRRAARRV